MREPLVHVRARGRTREDVAWRLLTCPPSGAGGGYYRALAAADVDLWTARYPGRESRIAEPPAASIGALADEITAPLLGVVVDGLPTVVLGHSMGVDVAVEVTRRLVAAGRTPDLLALSARRASDQENADDVDALRRVTASDDALTAWTIGLGGIPEELLADPEFMGLHLRTLRDDLRICVGHRPEPAEWAVPMLLICGDEDPAVDLDHMRGWAAFTTGPVADLVLPGGHQAVVDCAPTVLDALRSALGLGSVVTS